MKRLNLFFSDFLDLFTQVLVSSKSKVFKKVSSNLFIGLIILLLAAALASLPDILANLPLEYEINADSWFGFINFDYYKGLGTGLGIYLSYVYGRHMLEPGYLKNEFFKSKRSFNSFAFLFMFSMVMVVFVYKINTLYKSPDGLAGFISQWELNYDIIYELNGLWGLLASIAGYLAIISLGAIPFQKKELKIQVLGFFTFMVLFDLVRIITSNIKFYVLDPVKSLIVILMGDSLLSATIFILIYAFIALIMFNVTCIFMVELVRRIKLKIQENSIINNR